MEHPYIAMILIMILSIMCYLAGRRSLIKRINEEMDISSRFSMFVFKTLKLNEGMALNQDNRWYALVKIFNSEINDEIVTFIEMPTFESDSYIKHGSILKVINSIDICSKEAYDLIQKQKENKKLDDISNKE